MFKIQFMNEEHILQLILDTVIVLLSHIKRNNIVYVSYIYTLLLVIHQ